MPSTKRAFSTTSIFLFTLGTVGLLISVVLFVLLKNSMHFIPSGIKWILSFSICGSSVALITSLIGIYSGFQLKKIFIYIYIGGCVVVTILFLGTTVTSFIGVAFPDWSLTHFWNGLNSNQKAFTEVAYRCCGWKAYSQNDCAYYPIPGEVQAPCYAKLYFPYNGFIIMTLILGTLASVMCVSFIGMAVYFIITFKVGNGSSSSAASKKDDDYQRVVDEFSENIEE
ncbi:hypothetical protein ENUP19_0063G0012 [Entamoeba nuttalli]|uniref:Tetraspanin family protein n=2 Tax=Entamoeba nuttalli TaxID=412467 RepID=K2H7J0_ENTNP|nr:hypothetical protein ENU1_017640 [Entamoeba nuttalli P19]EKE42552.1 hypothetical protein ENU1_017640 [Entamoeba nuttalli P19]|eukprot:XP_008855110.1 hypothetical protein ENU1_017640 [Entamoeba nuttalli P19]